MISSQVESGDLLKTILASSDAHFDAIRIERTNISNKIATILGKVQESDPNAVSNEDKTIHQAIMNKV